MQKFLIMVILLTGIYTTATAHNKVVVIPLGGEEHYMYWQGDWVTDKVYKKGDAVYMDGSSYLCIEAHTSSPTDYPPYDTYWELIAAEGTTGPQGNTGDTGPMGPEGPSGSSSWVDGAGQATTTVNIGIGTPNPTQKLDVTGTVKASSFVGDGSSLSNIVKTETDPNVNALGKASLSCTSDQMAKWNGSAWACADDINTQLSESTVEAHIANDITAGYVPYDNGTKLSTSGVFYDGSKVGIGTTNPVSTLDINGYIHLSENTSPPSLCDTSQKGAIALTSLFTTCVCDGANWVLTADGITECTWNDEPLPPLPLDMIILLDRSGSIAGNWNLIDQAFQAFFTDINGDDVNAGINYFPNPVVDPCISSSYDPLQVSLVAIPANASTLTTSIQSQIANGPNTPIYSALLGSLQFATNYKDNNLTREVIVVLITDGDQSGCDNNGINEITELVSIAYNYNGVKTYAIAVDGATITNLNAIAAAGGTTQAYDITGNVSLLSPKLLEVRTDAVSQ